MASKSLNRLNCGMRQGPGTSAPRSRRSAQLVPERVFERREREGEIHLQRVGRASWLARSSSSARSPATSRSAEAGACRTAGRPRTRPSVSAKARLVTACGATAFTGPTRRSSAIAWRRTPSRSSRAIQLMNCSPLPSGPPNPNRNGGTNLARRPPRPASTTPSEAGRPECRPPRLARSPPPRLGTRRQGSRRPAAIPRSRASRHRRSTRCLTRR